MILSKLLNRRDEKAEKIFCIGRNKTGTTSLKKALLDLGYTVGDQATAELLIHDYGQRNFGPIVEYCKTAQAFQDVPFSLPYTYQILDYVFPSAKFILSMRDSEDQWYDSMIRFQMKRLNLDQPPTKEDRINDTYRYKGWGWDSHKIIYDPPEKDPYNEEILKTHYLRHNANIIDYFRFKNNLLVINLSHQDSYQRFCDFLGREPLYEAFPWLNKSAQ